LSGLVNSIDLAGALWSSWVIEWWARDLTAYKLIAPSEYENQVSVPVRDDILGRERHSL